ncbi:MAG: ArsO family NAD(P)H-dependent flavin-containing monooxygenase [Chloroflexota bacterium]|nr:ArsO family NAD(P)H-dependent flavin-containing monooxygenase [Chloroflexota bacterium]
MRANTEPGRYEVLVIGGGQAGLSVGYYLRRTGLSYVILDAQAEPGGAWLHGWHSLTLFSPARWSSLPGWIMPGGASEYPGREAVLAYMSEYEQRYDLPIARPVRVTQVRARPDGLEAVSDSGIWQGQAIVSATGTWEQPYVPPYPGRELFGGPQPHSAHYISPEPFKDKRVLVIGGGNSGAQILADLSLVADATWVTRRPPQFMPDYVDGRYLFDLATRKYLAEQRGDSESLREVVTTSLGNIVMVPPVKEARDRGVLHSVEPFIRFTETGVIWPDGREERIDAVVWCTGFKSALDHLDPLGVIESDCHIEVVGTRSVKQPRLWLVGYGDWTGYASATLIGVGRTARSTVAEIAAFLRE